jgi:hypothetical protein
VADPVSIEELSERGMEDRLAEIIRVLVGETIHLLPPSFVLTPTEMFALGYGPPCECGDRGLKPEEMVCTACGYCHECCDCYRED